MAEVEVRAEKDQGPVAWAPKQRMWWGGGVACVKAAPAGPEHQSPRRTGGELCDQAHGHP